MTAEALRHGPVADAIRRHRLVVVLRRVEPREALLALVGELADAGARAFEVTFDAPAAAEDLAAVKALLCGRDDGPCLVGAGTVTSRKQLEAARRAGAEFAVSPFFDPSLVDAATAEGLPFVPGILTPSEAHAAWSAGATFLKLFPASSVGPQFVRELRGPMPDVQLIPTGGVDASNARAFLDAGAAAVGIGGALVWADGAARWALIAGLRADAAGATGSAGSGG